MRLSFLLLITSIALSTTASVVIPQTEDYLVDYRDVAEDVMFRPGGSKWSDSESDDDSPPPSRGGSRTPSPSRGGSRSPSPKRPVSIEDDPNFDMGPGGEGQLDRLGLVDQAERTAIENEHKLIVKAQMKAFGATRAEIQKLAHSKGSEDSNIHITATLYGYRKGKGGKTVFDTLPSSFGKGEKGNYHHIYVNPANPADGLSVVRANMPVYYAAVQRKQKKKAHEVPDLRRREEDD